MAIGSGSLIEVVVTGSYDGQTMSNVWQYEVTSSPGGITGEEYAAAWWNNVKTVYRAVPTTPFTNAFESVSVRELDTLVGDYGVYAVPSGERAGTGSVGSEASPLPLFNAIGVRLSVGTRVTRPGQKRFSGLVEADSDNARLQSRAISAAEALMTHMVAGLTLGAPALTATMALAVVRKDVDGLPVAYQQVQGYSVNPYMTSQVSRKKTR